MTVWLVFDEVPYEGIWQDSIHVCADEETARFLARKLRWDYREYPVLTLGEVQP